MGFDNLLYSFDQSLTTLFSQWSTSTTTLTTLLVLLITYALITRVDPDTHPMLLARQAQPSAVRQQHESPVYRAFAVPHGMALNQGLNVVDEGASKWSQGRDGDLRDVWRQVVKGKEGGGKGKILTVNGRESVLESSLESLTRQINLVGKHVNDQGGNRVAIYLPNSVEFVAALFACAFYNLTAVLIPFDQDANSVITMLKRSAADTVITLPGAFPFDTVVKTYPALRQLIWVVEEGNAHLDWNQVPEGSGSSVNVTTWQDVLHDAPAEAGKELPPLAGQGEARDVTMFWLGKPGTMEEMVRFTSSNLVSAIAGQVFAVPQNQRMGPADLFLPADSLANSYTLILTLTALWSNASVAFNSVAGGQVADLATATMGIAPTVVVASPKTLLATHASYLKNTAASTLASWIHRFQSNALIRTGAMPTASFLSRLQDSLTARNPGKLRMIYTLDQVNGSSTEDVRLSSAVLNDLRILTGARVMYAMTAAKVAGAVAQTSLYDYRVFDEREDKGKGARFGAPLTCVEVLLRDKGGHVSTDEGSAGEIVVRGPCVAGGEAALGVVGKINYDNTLSYA